MPVYAVTHTYSKTQTETKYECVNVYNVFLGHKFTKCSSLFSNSNLVTSVGVHMFSPI